MNKNILKKFKKKLPDANKRKQKDNEKSVKKEICRNEEYNRNKIRVLDKRFDFSEAFTEDLDFNQKKLEKSAGSKKTKSIKISRDKHGIKRLDNISDFSCVFGESECKNGKLKRKRSISHKKTHLRPSKMTLEKRLSRYPKPEKSLDLHGYNAIQSRLKLESFIMDAAKKKFFTLRIITGKGLHSPNGAVLPEIAEEIVEMLKGEQIVLHYKWENSTMDDSGSMIVYLNRFDF